MIVSPVHALYPLSPPDGPIRNVNTLLSAPLIIVFAQGLTVSLGVVFPTKTLQLFSAERPNSNLRGAKK